MTGATLLLFSLVLGAWAYDEAASDALRSWERRHAPSARIWELAIGARAYGAAARPSKAARSLPVRLEPEGTAWISGDNEWVAVFASPETDPPYRIYCRSCDSFPTSWDPAGRGWDALERVLARVDRSRKPPPSPKAVPVLDPREIRY